MRFIDLMAGIGGSRLAFEQAGGQCVFCCEIDENKREIYEINFGDKPCGDIRDIDEQDIPDHDILITSLPLQSLSKMENRGSMEIQKPLLHEIVRILNVKQPRAFLIETGKAQSSHEETFNNMNQLLNDLGYIVHCQSINAKGLIPQNKEHVYMVGFRNNVHFEFPYIPQEGPALETILEDYVDEKYTLSNKHWHKIQERMKQRPTLNKRLVDKNSYSGPLSSNYLHNPLLLVADNRSNPRRLTPRECARLQGFPDEFFLPASDYQAYRQLGSSSVVPVVRLIAKEIVRALNQKEQTNFLNTGIDTEEKNIGNYPIKFKTEKELMDYTRQIIGKSFKEIDKKNILKRSSSDKGRLGKVIETGFYGYELNNRCEADFAELGIELKVSGFNTLQDGSWSAKERISLSMINYKEIIHEEFEFSRLISKNRKLLIIWYEYVKGVPYEDFIIRDYQLYDMSIDEPIIRNDFYLIKHMVEDGLAHKLSEGQSVILGAATKGQKGQTAEQPNSPILAPTRAFSLKNSFFRGVLRDHTQGIMRHGKSVDFVTPEGFVWEKLKPYKGMTQMDILNHFIKIDLDRGVPKNVSKMVSDRVVGRDSELPKEHEVFSKSTFIIKNIPIMSGNYPLEKATFSTLHVTDFTSPWEESEWKRFFEEVTFIYIAYIGVKDGKELKNGDRILDRVFKITFTADEVENFGKTYNMIKRAIEEKNTELLPTASSDKNGEYKIVIAPKGRVGGVYDRFLDGKRETCFMLNKDFLHRKFNEALTLY